MKRLDHFPKIRVHPFAAAGIFLLLFAMPRAYAFAVLSSVLLHEAGHLMASLFFGKRPEYIKLMPTGISIGLAASSSYVEEIVIAAAGPLMNFLYIAVSPCFPSDIAPMVQSVSLLLGVLNLLPIATFDGGRICGGAVAFFLGDAVAERFLQLMTVCFLSVLWVFSLYIFFYSGVNMTLLVFCAYLFSYLIVKKL